MASARIQKEIRDMMNCKDSNITASIVNETDIFRWKATIKGPTDTPYQGGVFKLAIKLGNDYPFKPPKIKFVTPIYHCNISRKGEICLDILKDGWSPALTIEKTLLSLITLLECPNPKDPLEPEIAREMKEDGLSFLQTAQTMTKRHAMLDAEDESSDEDEYDSE
jgi:ubiquitin-conjugating enzyme E2 D